MSRGVLLTSWIYSRFFSLLCLFLVNTVLNRTDGADKVFTGLPGSAYSVSGDINIGVLLTLTQGVENGVCSGTLMPGTWGIQLPEAAAFAVLKVNQDGTILPNVTLGLHILDDCYSYSMGLAQSLSFVIPQRVADVQIAANDSCLARNSFDSSLSAVSYDVIGMVASISSTETVSLSYLSSAAGMPLVGYLTSSDELSNKALHPTFFRVISPDRYQAEAMMRFIHDHGWSYVSIVYSIGPYGERGYDNLKASAGEMGICVAYSHRVISVDETDTVVSELLSRPMARVVILFAKESHIISMLASSARFNATGQFIWIGCDSMVLASKSRTYQFADVLAGAFVFFFYSPPVKEFYQHLQTTDGNGNPWFNGSWRQTFNCSPPMSQGSCEGQGEGARYDFLPVTTLIMDAVLTYAYAAGNLIRELCPGVTGTAARSCVTNERLVRYIRSAHFRGYSGEITFDENGDSGGKYVIYQVSRVREVLTPSEGYVDPYVPMGAGLVLKEVANYDRTKGEVNYTGQNISWNHVFKRDRVVPLNKGESATGVPESVCSAPCAAGEYKIQKEPKCCWECRRCRDNEILTDDGSSCEECPEFFWPDPESGFTTCALIPPTYQSPSDTLSILLMTTATLATALTILVGVAYCVLREARVIKAASRELSTIQLLAVQLGYVNVITLQVSAPPTTASCAANYFMFCVSFSALYAPLLVKTVRIYRIFASTSRRGLRLVSPASQLVKSVVLILVQVILCFVIFVIYRPSGQKVQPVRTEKFVELTCTMTLPGLASFLSYNLVLASLCAVFAFKIRRLPDNFNESRFIVMCVSTTLVIWLAFIPTYFTAEKGRVQTLLLSAALLLNHTVALVFLFLPKIYAAVYVGEMAPCPSSRVTHSSRINAIRTIS